MKRATRRQIAATPLLLLAVFVARSSAAHPAGFTSVNRYIGVSFAPSGQIHLAYLLDFAELPSYAEIEDLDADHDGNVTPTEQRAYLDRRVPPLVARWLVEVNGARSPVHVTGSSLEVLVGERGLSTLRIAADVMSDLAPPLSLDASAARVHVVDPAFADRSGWRQMAAEATAEATVVEHQDDGASGRAPEILAYGHPAPGGPPRIDDAVFEFRARRPDDARAATERPTDAGRAVTVDPRLSRLAAMMRGGSFSTVALVLAFALGAAHALSPGHGKTLAAAYLVGRRARAWQAIAFGVSMAVAHTAVVYALGGLALTVERTLGSDRVLRGLQLASAVSVVALGVVQLSQRWADVTSVTSHGADHGHGTQSSSENGWRSLWALAASAGLAPCPSALALLLGAVALHRYGFGLFLVAAFSAGVALTLTVAGLLVVAARRVLDRMAGAAPFLRWLPVASSTCILLLGILLCASAWSTGTPQPW